MFNKSSNLYGGEWLALVFANRNQNYGAFELRRQSSSRLLKAFFIAAPLFVSAFVAPSIISALKGEEVAAKPIIDDIVEIDLTHNVKPKEEPKEEPKKAEPKAQEEEAPKSIAPKVKTVGMTDKIKVVSDDLVTLSPPTSNDLKDAVIGRTTQDGVPGKINVDLGTDTGVPGGGVGVGGNGAGDGNKIHDISSLDSYPEFPGGMEAWSKYIQRNLRYPSMAQEEGVGGKVFLSFVVEKDGMITDVKVTRGIGFGCDEEAMRVIKKSPRWKAGMQNNLPVRVRYNIPINYTISN